MTPQFGSKAPVWFIYFHFFLFAFCFFSLKHSKPDVLHRSDIYFGTESRKLTWQKEITPDNPRVGTLGDGGGWSESAVRGRLEGDTREWKSRALLLPESERMRQARASAGRLGMNFTRTARSTPHRKRVRAADSSTVSLRLTETIHRSVFSVTMASDWAYGHELSLVKTLKECARNWAHDKANR